MVQCKFCSSEFPSKRSAGMHGKVCKQNPNGRPQTNRFIKAKQEGREIVVSEETRNRIADANKRQEWSEERRKKHSDSMRKAVLDNPESYTSSNVSGRVKLYEINGTKVKGTWELAVAEYLNENGYSWTNDVQGFPYQWNDKTHHYFPDFYLPEFDVYVEVKGYKTERDDCKWNAFPHRLIVLKSAEVKQIRKGEFTMGL